MEERTTNKKNLIFIVIGIVLFFAAFIYSYNIYKTEGEKRSVFVEKIPEGKTDYIDIMGYIVTIDPLKGETYGQTGLSAKGFT